MKARTTSVSVGARAPASRTPTVGTAALTALTTRQPPDHALLRHSVSESLAARAPFVVTFATPRFCVSRTCGPIVDVVDAVRRSFEPQGIRFSLSSLLGLYMVWKIIRTPGEL
ncbi:MAG: hypothetical protein M3R70_13540 [Actinomycetota bacterium]|nr:hypothetical protein [Actinomycetota bacterium]